MVELETLVQLVIANAVLGAILCTLALYGHRAVRNVVEERDSQYPAYRRLDVKNWNIPLLYLGACTILVPRLMINISILIVVTIYSYVFYFGTNYPDPLPQWKLPLVRFGEIFLTELITKVSGCWLNIKYVQSDYSYYLGPDYKKNENGKPPSIIVTNHVSWLDPFIISNIKSCGYVAKMGFKDAPFAGVCTKFIGGLFIDRGATEELRMKIISDIYERQKQAEAGVRPPLCLFPEGGTSNGHAILAFKRGAFQSLMSCQPMVLDFRNNHVTPAFDVILLFPLLITNISCFRNKATVYVLPKFQPNEYLFKTHKDKGKEKREIYAWAIREIMAKTGNFPLDDQPYREKLIYESNLHGWEVAKND